MEAMVRHAPNTDRLTVLRGWALSRAASTPIVTRRMRSPWLGIPLPEYEGHMSLPTVGPAELLADEFAKLLAEYAPPTVAVVGCAGGNGFDRIPVASTSRVVGIDVNPAYIATASRRFAARIPGLELYAADIQRGGLSVERVDLIYAALVFEYVELEPTLHNLALLCKRHGILGTLLQLPSRSVPAVTPSPFASLQALASSMKLVPPETLVAQAAKAGFALLSSHRVLLPSRKEFAVQIFRLRAVDASSKRTSRGR